MLIQALEAAMETLPSREISVDVVEEGPIPYDSRRADALAALAENFLAKSGSSSTTADRYQVVVHVDAETLRDGGCRFPGCTHERYVDAHHIEHWADGGETKLSNLVTLCRLHHRLVHEGEIRIETSSDGSWRFLHPDGSHFEVIRRTTPPSYTWEDLEHTHTELGIHIDADTAATRWRGERMDYDLGVWILCQQAKRGTGDVAAETSEPAGDADSPRTQIAHLR
jgi:HNH endonuclease